MREAQPVRRPASRQIVLARDRHAGEPPQALAPPPPVVDRRGGRERLVGLDTEEGAETRLDPAIRPRLASTTSRAETSPPRTAAASASTGSARSSLIERVRGRPLRRRPASAARRRRDRALRARSRARARRAGRAAARRRLRRPDAGSSSSASVSNSRRWSMWSTILPQLLREQDLLRGRQPKPGERGRPAHFFEGERHNRSAVILARKPKRAQSK